MQNGVTLITRSTTNKVIIIMTIAKDFASKFAVAFVAAAMIFSSFASAVSAQETTEDLQKTINDLLAQVAELQKTTTTTTTTTTSVGSCNFMMDLKTGSTGADVMALQKFLNSDEDTRVAAAGMTGSAGMETSYYGPATAAAVSKFQVKYRAEILSPAGLVNPTGFFGPGSRAHANALCAGSDDSEDTDDEDDTDSEDSELQGEGTLDTFEMDDASDTDVQEGTEDAEIAEITVEATDGDIEIDRITFEINDGGVANTETDPWEVFETITLWVDGDMIAEFDASDEDEYLDEDTGEFRFSGLDLVAMEDEELDIVVGATVVGSVDDAGSATLADWDLTATAVRYFDADGVAEDDITAGELPTADAGFTIVEAGDGEELKFSLGSNNPEATDIIVDEDDKTNGVTILEYTIEAQEGDIELNTLFVNVAISAGETYADVVDDIYLVVDGEEFDDESNTTFANGSTTVEFDIDGDVTIDEDSEVTVEVVVDFKSQATYANGTSIEARVRSIETAATDAEGMDDVNEFSGTAVGDEHTLVAEGILVPVDGFTGTVDTLGDNDTIGEFTLEFEVTAVEGDFYITENAAAASTSPTNGVSYTVTGGNGTVTDSLTSTADEDTAGVFTVRDGETETFTLVVTIDPAAAGTFRVSLDEVFYATGSNGTTGVLGYTPTPVTDFRTGTKSINQ